MERHRVMLGDIDPRLWARVKAEAALAQKPIGKWVAEALLEAVEDAEDVRDGLESMQDRDRTATLEEYIARERAVSSKSSSPRAKKLGRSTASRQAKGSRRVVAASA